MDAPKLKRRIVPIFLGAVTTPAPPLPEHISPATTKPVAASILEKQTELLGPALVYRIATGKATQADIDERVVYLNNQGHNFTPESLLWETKVKTSIEYNPHIQSWLKKWEPIAAEEEKRAEKRKIHRKSKPRDRSKNSRHRHASRNKSRNEGKTAYYKPQRCLEHTILASRRYAKRKRIILGRSLRRKADICAHIIKQMST